MPRLHAPGFSVLPYALMDQLGEHKNVAWLYLWLHRHGHGSDQGTWASIATLARECRMHKDAVSLALRWLVEHGWAVRVSRPGRTSVYHLRLEAPEPAHPPNEGCLPSPNQGIPLQRHPSPIRGKTPIPRTGETTHPSSGGYKQEPRNQNPTTRTRVVSSNSQVPLSLSAPLALRTNWDDHRATEQPAVGQPEAPCDPDLPIEQRYPDFPWGGPLARKAPVDPPAEAPHLPVPVERLPVGLQPIADCIETYWLAKGGARHQAAFVALIEELQLVLPASGRSGVVELLRQAQQAGWPAINARAWLDRRSREPDPKRHPAYRSFSAA